MHRRRARPRIVRSQFSICAPTLHRSSPSLSPPPSPIRRFPRRRVFQLFTRMARDRRKRERARARRTISSGIDRRGAHISFGYRVAFRTSFPPSHSPAIVRGIASPACNPFLSSVSSFVENPPRSRARRLFPLAHVCRVVHPGDDGRIRFSRVGTADTRSFFRVISVSERPLDNVSFSSFSSSSSTSSQEHRSRRWNQGVTAYFYSRVRRVKLL